MLPKEYGEMSKTTLLEYFPSSFSSDLNGKTNAYEAIILIPFFKEELFLGAEAELLKKIEMTAEDKKRNTISLGYLNYRFSTEEASKEPVESTLTHLSGLKEDLSTCSFTENLEQIGKHCFASKMLPGVEIPIPGWQSFKHLNIRGTMVDQVKSFNRS
jgi:5'-3' exonuclease